MPLRRLKVVKTVNVEISHGQLAAFSSSMRNPSNDWTVLAARRSRHVPAADIGGLCTRLALPQNPDNLLVREPALARAVGRIDWHSRSLVARLCHPFARR